MTVTILDTETGKQIESSGMGPYWWAEGNGSCDCNRAGFSGVDLGREPIGDSPLYSCAGCRRFLIVKATMEPRDEGEAPTLEDLNHGYPSDLKSKFLPKA